MVSRTAWSWEIDRLAVQLSLIHGKAIATVLAHKNAHRAQRPSPCHHKAITTMKPRPWSIHHHHSSSHTARMWTQIMDSCEFMGDRKLFREIIYFCLVFVVSGCAHLQHLGAGTFHFRSHLQHLGAGTFYFASQLQHFGAGTFQFACQLQHLGWNLPFCMILSFVCNMLELESSIWHSICKLLLVVGCCLLIVGSCFLFCYFCCNCSCSGCSFCSCRYRCCCNSSFLLLLLLLLLLLWLLLVKPKSP